MIFANAHSPNGVSIFTSGDPIQEPKDEEGFLYNYTNGTLGLSNLCSFAPLMKNGGNLINASHGDGWDQRYSECVRNIQKTLGFVGRPLFAHDPVYVFWNLSIGRSEVPSLLWAVPLSRRWSTGLARIHRFRFPDWL